MDGHEAPPPPPPPPASTNIPPAPPMPVPPVYGGWVATTQAPNVPMQLATPWRRLGAYVIDALVFLPVWIGVFFGLFFHDFANDPLFDEARAGIQPSDAQIQAFVNRLQGKFFVYALVVGALYGVYNVLFTKLRGQTLGKMAVGVKVVQIYDGSLPTWGNAGLRWALPTIVGLVPFYGSIGVLLIYLWMFWDPNKQGLHDKLAKTIVLRVFPGQRL